ncbi:MAG: hypothetical protein WA823_21380 [Candidatus Acidiferrales bacterium]
MAKALDELASQEAWDAFVWQACFDLVAANADCDPLLNSVYDDVIHFSGVIRTRNILGFRVKPDTRELEEYRKEFRDVAAWLRAHLSLKVAQGKYGF